VHPPTLAANHLPLIVRRMHSFAILGLLATVFV
jgi:hypothetical protein